MLECNNFYLTVCYFGTKLLGGDAVKGLAWDHLQKIIDEWTDRQIDK